VDNWDYWSDPDNKPYQVVEDLGTTDLSFSPAIIAGSKIDVEPVRHLHFELFSRYVGKQYIDNTSSEERILEPYLVNDARISYSFYPQHLKEFSLQLKVANLFNAAYETNAWVYRYYYGGEEGVLDGFYPQAGTHVMAGIRLRF
jgi:iron complex outermembrane receptor protein